MESLLVHLSVDDDDAGYLFSGEHKPHFSEGSYLLLLMLSGRDATVLATCPDPAR